MAGGVLIISVPLTLCRGSGEAFNWPEDQYAIPMGEMAHRSSSWPHLTRSSLIQPTPKRINPDIDTSHDGSGHSGSCSKVGVCWSSHCSQNDNRTNSWKCRLLSLVLLMRVLFCSVFKWNADGEAGKLFNCLPNPRWLKSRKTLGNGLRLLLKWDRVENLNPFYSK